MLIIILFLSKVTVCDMKNPIETLTGASGDVVAHGAVIRASSVGFFGVIGLVGLTRSAGTDGHAGDLGDTA